MTTRGRPHPDERVERLVLLARDVPAESLTPREWARLHRLERSLRDGKRPHRVSVRMFTVAAATLVAAAALVVALRLRDRPLTYEVTNATVSDGGYISTADGKAAVRFSDRS